MDTDLTISIVVYVAGMVAMIVELFIPGAVMGVLGFLAVIGSIVYAVTTNHLVAAAVEAGLAVIAVPAFFLLWKNVVAKFMALNTDQKGYMPSTTIDTGLVGAEGVALSPLHPSGIAQLNNRRYDVVTRGEMLEKGTRVCVIEVSGNRVVVRKL